MERIAVSVTEAAEMLGMCPKTVYQLTRRADFPAFKAGNRTVISAACDILHIGCALLCYIDITHGNDFHIAGNISS